MYEGAELVPGSDRTAGFDREFFVSPRVFREVTNDMCIAREETCGPVLSVLRYEDTAEAIANDSGELPRRVLRDELVALA